MVRKNVVHAVAHICMKLVDNRGHKKIVVAIYPFKIPSTYPLKRKKRLFSWWVGRQFRFQGCIVPNSRVSRLFFFLFFFQNVLVYCMCGVRWYYYQPACVIVFQGERVGR